MSVVHANRGSSMHSNHIPEMQPLLVSRVWVTVIQVVAKGYVCFGQCTMLQTRLMGL